jgi:hypothetical protein
MKCNNCGNPDKVLSMKLIVENMENGEKYVKEGCGICIAAEVLASCKFADAMSESNEGLKFIEKMATDIFNDTYENFKKKTAH